MEKYRSAREAIDENILDFKVVILYRIIKARTQTKIYNRISETSTVNSI